MVVRRFDIPNFIQLKVSSVLRVSIHKDICLYIYIRIRAHTLLIWSVSLNSRSSHVFGSEKKKKRKKSRTVFTLALFF